MAGRLSSASVESGIGLAPVDLRPGQVSFHVPLVAGSKSADGRLEPMTLAVVADTAVGVAVFSERPGESAGVTAELCVDHAGPLGVGAHRLDVVAKLLGTRPGFGTGRVEVRDDTGALVAHAVGVVAVDAVPLAAPPPERVLPRRFEPADVRVVPVDPGSARVDIRPEMLNRRGTVHGGVLLGLVHEAQELFRLGMGVRGRPLQVSADYLRPAPGSGQLLLCSSLVRRGRHVWIVRTAIVDSGGRTVVVAHGTSAMSAGVAAGK
jgi:uncharacterized protein (TIGR00369 family)